MRVVSLRVANFRSIDEELTIGFRSSHAVFVESNNAGKPNVLSALDWVLGRRPYQLRVHPHDYFDPTQAIEIEATLGEIYGDDRKHLFPLCTNKQQRGALSRKTDPTISITLTVAPIEAGEPTEVGGDGEVEEPNASRTKLEISLWGFEVHRRVTDVRTALVNLLIVTPHRRVDDDLSASRWTPYGALMKSVLEASPQFPDLQRLSGAVNSGINDAFADQKDQLLADARVVAYVEDVAFQLTKDNNPVELLRSLEITVTEDGRSISLDRVGTGTQSAVIIGMLELVLRSKDSRTKIFAIEEPDAFIHPHGTRHLASLLKRIASEPSAQIVLSTHSPALLATLPPGEIIRVEKRDGHTQVFQPAGTLTDPTFAKFINQDTTEMFFANSAVLVEGATERFLLPPLSGLVQHKGQSLDFSRSCTSIIDIGGKSGIVTYLKLMHEFDIDARAILDNDFLGDPTCAALVKYLRARGDTIDDSSDSSLCTDLNKLGIIVLSKGEIENYIPEADVATASSRSPTEVTAALAKHKNASNSFKELFGTGKPQYAMALADLYLSRAAVPSDINRLIVRVGS